MKRIIFLAVFFCFISGVRGQDYYHAVGIKANMAVFNLEYTQNGFPESNSDGGFVPGLFYKAMLGFEIDRNSMFGIAAYPFFGLSGVFSSRGGTSSDAGIGFELPVVCEYMIGDPEDYHFYANVGLSFLAMATTQGSGTIFGPRIGLGGQFEMQGQLVGIKAAFLYGINSRSGFDPDWVITKQRNYGISIGAFYTL